MLQYPHMWTALKRVTRAGFVNFFRNGVVSLAAILIMTVTLFVIGVTIFLGALLNSSLDEIRNKVDVNVYFVTDAAEENILSLAEDIRTLPEVSEVTYTSREQALEEFRARHQDDQLTIQALDELDENPLGASLSIKAHQPGQYEGIATFLDQEYSLQGGAAPFIDSINYYQNKQAIDSLTAIIKGVEAIGTGVIVFLALISVVISFNTIRLAIYSAREEIGVMRLVGASNRYIRAPFLVEGALYGLCASFIVMLLFYPATWWAGPHTERFFGSLNVFDYYLAHFGELFFIIVGSGIILGLISSLLAIRRYLKV